MLIGSTRGYDSVPPWILANGGSMSGYLNCATGWTRWAGWARLDSGRGRVRRDFFHAANAVHGSVYFKLLDDATFFAASSLVDDVFVLTASFNIYFLRPISIGVMTARGTVVSRTSRLIIGEGVLVDGDGKEIARGTGTFMPSRVPLDERLGYR